MNIKPQYAPGPYQTQDVGCQTSFHAYVVDANGRKIGVAWGPVAEKVWTQALFSASHDMLKALKDFDYLSFVIESAVRKLEQPHTADSVVFAIKQARTAIAKIEGDAAITSTDRTEL